RDARSLLCLSSRTHQLPVVLWIRRKAGAMPLKFSVGLAPCSSANAKRSRKFHRPYAALLGTTLALQLLSLSLFSVAIDGERLIMTVRVKFERNKMSRGYRLLWSDDLFQSRNPSEWNGIVGKTRESL